MKALIFLLSFIAASLQQDDCPSFYGFNTQFPITGSVGGNYVIGNQFYFMCDAEVVSFNGWFEESGSGVYFGLYTDNEGSPGALVASSSQTVVTEGKVTATLDSPVNVPQGFYWIMALYETFTSPYVSKASPFETYTYVYTDFYDGLPDSMYNHTVETGMGLQYNLWIDVGAGSCPNVFGQDTPFLTFSTHSPDYLLGNQLNITCEAYITALGAFFNFPSGLFQLAVYSDYYGNPYELVASIPASQSVEGVNLIALENPVKVFAGTYWIMGFYEESSYPGYNGSDSDVVVKYMSQPFDYGLPSIFGTPTTYYGQLFNYWAEVQQTFCQAQVGYPDAIDSISTHSPNYLLGNAFNVSCDSYVNSINAFISADTGEMLIGIYSDSYGNPDTLLVSAGPFETKNGQVTEALTPQFYLPQGTYWLMALYQETSYPSYNETDTTVVKYVSQDFDEGLPIYVSNPSTYYGQLFSYWLDVTVVPDNQN